MDEPRVAPVPCLALKHGAVSDKPVLFSISEATAIDSNGGVDLPGLTNGNAWVTPQGWILVRSASDAATFLQNPQDPDGKIHLPHLPHELPSTCTCLLSGKPVGDERCIVLLIEPDDATFLWYCHIGCGEGEEEWARHEYDIGTQRDIRPGKEGQREKVPICSIAACRGRFYFNAKLESVGVLEFTPTAAPSFGSIAIDDPLPGGYGVYSDDELYMGESHGRVNYTGLELGDIRITMDEPRRAPVPCLAIKHGADSGKPALFSISEATAINNGDIPGLTNGNAWVTPQGWILVRSVSDAATFLQNPQDPDGKIHLPHLPHELPSTCSCRLSGKPNGSESCIVLVVETEEDAIVLWYCRFRGGGGGGGEGEGWVRHEYDVGTQWDIRPGNEGQREKVPICSIAACRGKFYFNATPKSVGVLEFTLTPTTPVFGSIAIADPLPGGYGVLGVALGFLVESEDDLYMVRLLLDRDFETVYDLIVYKMDFSDQQWHEVDDIGGRAFLLAPAYFGASHAADECGLEKDSFYVPYAHKKCFEKRKGISMWLISLKLQMQKSGCGSCPLSHIRDNYNATPKSVGVLEFTPTAPVFGSITIADPLPGGYGVLGVALGFLVESEDDLYMVRLLLDRDFETIYDLIVYKMDFSEQQWHEVDDIGGHAFLLAPAYFGTSHAADECGLEKDSFYVPYAHKKCFEVCKVEEKGDIDVVNLIEAPDAKIGMWIMPTD
uniref:KIB1-4 beta-propeller domain-containing protein n=1 Tax=Oryza meridionalis TaxID=40149 RepID=A0A0E0D5L4_9ORYZ